MIEDLDILLAILRGERRKIVAAMAAGVSEDPPTHGAWIATLASIQGAIQAVEATARNEVD